MQGTKKTNEHIASHSHGVGYSEEEPNQGLRAAKAHSATNEASGADASPQGQAERYEAARISPAAADTHGKQKARIIKSRAGGYFTTQQGHNDAQALGDVRPEGPHPKTSPRSDHRTACGARGRTPWRRDYRAAQG